jgi:rod shape-determining protein MreC
VAYGRGQSGSLELRFMASNADIQKGDVLMTSGIDGVYPAGLAVATVISVETKTADSFARILCLPTAGVSRNRQLLVLLTDAKAMPPLPPPVEDIQIDKLKQKALRKEKETP